MGGRGQRKFPLSYILHQAQRYRIQVSSHELTDNRLTLHAPLPCRHSQRQFMRVILFRWPRAEISWAKSVIIVDLSKVYYKPAKGSWSYEKQRTMRNGIPVLRDPGVPEPERKAFICRSIVRHCQRCDSSEMSSIESQGPGNIDSAGRKE